MHFLAPLLPFAFGWPLLFFTSDLTQLAWVNGAAQLLLFAVVVCIPACKQGAFRTPTSGGRWAWR